MGKVNLVIGPVITNAEEFNNQVVNGTYASTPEGL